MMKRVESNDPAAMTHAGVKQHMKGNYSGASEYWKAGCVSKEDLATALPAWAVDATKSRQRETAEKFKARNMDYVRLQF